MIVFREMDPEKVTDREGRWSLRHVAMDDEGIVHAFLQSERAPKGTKAVDLKPEAVEFVGLGEDELTLSLVDFAALSMWPPDGVRS